MSGDGEEFRLVCPALEKEHRLPRRFTDEGQGARQRMSPPLEWYNVPDGTKSMALVVEDIDAPDPSEPVVPWTLWVVSDIPPTLKGLPEGFSGKAEELGGEYERIKEGNNDEKVPGWRVPAMPRDRNTGDRGVHRFEFRLYALDGGDNDIRLGKTVTKERLLDAIQGRVIGEASLIAYF